MTTMACQLIHEVANHGGSIRIENGNLHLCAHQPLPGDLLAKLREHKAAVIALLSMRLDARPSASPLRHGFDAIFEEFSLDPLFPDDRIKATQIWLSRPAIGPPD
jgi:hypothetical protein